MRPSTVIARDLAVGAAAGLIASYAMNLFQKILTEPAKTGPQPDDAPEPATVKVADRLCLAITGKPIPGPQRPLAGNAVHYGLGAGLGAVYAAAARLAPAVAAGGGSAYSSAVWLGLDEGLLPALGLGDKWADVPASKHAYGWVSHLVFGLSLDGARRLLGRVGSKAASTKRRPGNSSLHQER